MKPAAVAKSAMLFPVASRGVVKDAADAAFSTSAPVTAGSTRGTIPRRASVVGSVGSEQNVGLSVADGLKFCSAATRPFAASSPPSPRVATISSALVSYSNVSNSLKKM